VVDVVPQQIRDLGQFTDLRTVNRLADLGVVDDYDANIAKGIPIGHMLDWIERVNLSGNTTLTLATHQNRIITNSTATGDITLTLWAATAGARVVFRRRAAYTMRITPASGEYIHTGAVNNYMDILGDGQIVLFCHDTGRWDLERDTALYQMQNYVPPVTGGLVNGEW